MKAFPGGLAQSARTLRRSLIALLFGLLISGTVLAQPRPRSPTVLFAPTGNFQNPGARSFALGGAFVGLADDASAAELNPAGLTQLRRPEISAEYRSLEARIPVEYTDAVSFGRFECIGGFDLQGTACDNSGTSEENSLSFVSLIVPGSARLTYALYRHELARRSKWSERGKRCDGRQAIAPVFLRSDYFRCFSFF